MMPIDYKNYPPNWKTEIRPRIMARAGEVRDKDGKITTEACCEWCGIKNKIWASYLGPYVKDLWAGDIYKYTGELPHSKLELTHEISWHLSDWNGDKGRRIILTIAHILPDKMNCEDSNLAALCQRCHLNYDRDHHKANARETRRKKKGMKELFEVENKTNA